jgi:uncharacterized membrane protein
MGSHFKRHMRFYSAAVLGIAASVITAQLSPALEVVVGADTFFAAYLVLVTLLVARATPDKLRQIASAEDEGIGVIVAIAIAAVTLSLASIFLLLAQAGTPDSTQLLLALISAPLGWLMLHTVAALHYAHRYYSADSQDGEPRDAGGLKFPDCSEPHAWDFIYHSFVIGMTAQVSDVTVISTSMRQVVLVHSVVAFVFNTILIAAAVNTAVALGH